MDNQEILPCTNCGHGKGDHHNAVTFCCEIDGAAYFCEIKGCHCEDFSALPQTEQDGTLPDGHDAEQEQKN